MWGFLQKLVSEFQILIMREQQLVQFSLLPLLTQVY